MSEKMKYCAVCGGCGITLKGEVCQCQLNVKQFYDAVGRIDIPPTYQGRVFNKVILSHTMPADYGNYLQEIYDNVTTLRWKNHNVMICSPPGTGKTTLAYSAIEQLFRKGISTLTLFDIFELKKIAMDYDCGRKPAYDVETPEDLVKAPYLFVRVPRVTNFDAYDTIAYILDKRVRRGGSTFFLYNGKWEDLIAMDKYKVVSSLKGDGSCNTLDCRTWDFIPKPNLEQ